MGSCGGRWPAPSRPTPCWTTRGWVDVTIAELLDAVGRKMKTTTTSFDLSSMILWYTMDAAGRFSFGEPLRCLAAESDVGGSIAMRQKRAPAQMVAAAVAKLKARIGLGLCKGILWESHFIP